MSTTYVLFYPRSKICGNNCQYNEGSEKRTTIDLKSSTTTRYSFCALGDYYEIVNYIQCLCKNIDWTFYTK